MYKKIAILGILTIAMLLTGCEKKQIFLRKGQEFELVPVKENALLQDTYYVKEGSTFYKTYKPMGTSGDGFVKKSRYFYLGNDKTLIPTLYSGELLAFASKDTSLNSIEVKRYKDLGYTIGIADGTYSKDEKCYYIKTGQNLIKGTDAYKKLSGLQSEDIKIVSINKENISSNMLSEAGTFLGLDENKKYHICYYAGSYYGETDIVSDVQMLQEFEYYRLNPASSTKNSYFSVELPGDFKPGYYAINDGNMFFYNYDRKNVVSNPNEAYYSSEEQQLETYAQKFVLTLNHPAVQADIFVKTQTEGVTGAVFSPDGTTYVMDEKSDGLDLKLASAIQGDWKVYVSPKEAQIDDIIFNYLNKDDEAIAEDYPVKIKEPTEATFIISYKGDEEEKLWGFIENNKGEIIEDFTKDDKSTEVKISFPRLEAGEYRVHVYHYNTIEKIAIDIKYEQQSTIIEVEQ